VEELRAGETVVGRESPLWYNAWAKTLLEEGL